MAIKPINAFKKAALNYAKDAKLQKAIANRLAKYCKDLKIPDGIIIDLGAGCGYLAESLEGENFMNKIYLIDNCKEMLSESKMLTERQITWDLNNGLPPIKENIAMIVSSFALQWLDEPMEQIKEWTKQLSTGGWLVLAVPVEGSFKSWREAAKLAHAPYTGNSLPASKELIKTIENNLFIKKQNHLCFTKKYNSGLEFLKELKHLGVNGGTKLSSNSREMKRMIKEWPKSISTTQNNGKPEISINWEIELVIAQKGKDK
jgi:malonyl-CoA O-methyltransferase